MNSFSNRNFFAILAFMASLSACRQSPDASESAKNMKSTHSHARFYALRLLPGQDLREELQRFANENNIQAGYIATCVGSLTEATIRYANQNGGTRLTGHYEILSLTGTISDQKMHLHISVADSVGRTLGGHLVGENKIFTTAEIVIGELTDYSFSLELDTASGFNELKIRPRGED